MGRRCPSLVRALAPASALLLEETAWNAYPYCKTSIYESWHDEHVVLTNPFLGERFSITVETTHIDNDAGQLDNVFNLDADRLKRRTVQYLDIAKETLPKEHYNELYEPAKVASRKTGRGPLREGWQTTMRPTMCCYKLVTIRAAIFAIQGHLERYTLSTQEHYFVKFYKKVFCLLDDWIDLDMEAVRDMEDTVKGEMDNVMRPLLIIIDQFVGVEDQGLQLGHQASCHCGRQPGQHEGRQQVTHRHQAQGGAAKIPRKLVTRPLSATIQSAQINGSIANETCPHPNAHGM
jgi:hypothetical protein